MAHPTEPRCLIRDERKSTIEALERWWRDSRQHYTSGSIGLGRYSDELEVVRVGITPWPELATWRYGRVLARRRRIALARLGAAVGVGAVGYPIALSSIAIGLLVNLALLLPVAPLMYSRFQTKRPVCRVPTSVGPRSLLREKHLHHLEFIADRNDDWRLHVQHDGGITSYAGPEGVRTMAYALPRINYLGARRSGVDDAMALIRESGGAEGLMAKAAREVSSRNGVGAQKALLYMSAAPVRIALEIASHEETERRALEDEIAMLRHEWREAEEIASMASRLA